MSWVTLRATVRYTLALGALFASGLFGLWLGLALGARGGVGGGGAAFAVVHFRQQVVEVLDPGDVAAQLLLVDLVQDVGMIPDLAAHRVSL